MEATSHSQFEGLLQKPARIIGRSTKVWCVLDGHSLMFFKESKRSSCIGHIDISDIQTIKKVGTKDGQFEILTSEKAQIFTAESSDLCKEWITHIQHAMSVKGQETPSDTSKTEHKPEKQKENFHIDMKSVKDQWKQRESKKEDTRHHTTPSPVYSPKKLPLKHKEFPFNKDLNKAAENESKEHIKTTRDDHRKQHPSAVRERAMGNNLEIRNQKSTEKNSDGKKKLENEMKSTGTDNENRSEQKKSENQDGAPAGVQSDNIKEVTSGVNKHDTDIQDDNNQVGIKNTSENKDKKTENKSDQLDLNKEMEEEPVVLRRKSRNINGTNGRKSVDESHHKSQEPVISTSGGTSFTLCGDVKDTTSDKTSNVIDEVTVHKTDSFVDDGASDKGTQETMTKDKSKSSFHESSKIDDTETVPKTSDCSTEYVEETSDDKVLLRKSSSSGNKDQLNYFDTSKVSMATARKTFPYTPETGRNQLDEDPVVLRPKSTSSRVTDMSPSKSSSEKSSSDDQNGGGSTSEEEGKVKQEADIGDTQKINQELDSLPSEDGEENPLFNVCKTEEIPSLDTVRSEEMSAWEELRNYLTTNFGSMSSVINGQTSEDKSKEDINPVLALKEYLNNFN